LKEEFPSEEMNRIHGIHTKNRNVRREINILEMIKAGIRNDEISREPNERKCSSIIKQIMKQKQANHSLTTNFVDPPSTRICKVVMGL
jgi:hypothetical protein